MKLGKVYEVLYSKNIRTIELMDKISYDGYCTLLLKGVFRIKYNDTMYHIGLYIQRMPLGTDYVRSRMTFTQLKDFASKFCYSEKDSDKVEVLQALFAELKTRKIIPNDNTINISFDKPVQFNAQNSGNRSGYGNYYRGDELVYQGTLYGETTLFAFVGATLRRW